MAINYVTALKTTRMQDVADAIDAGAGPGIIEFYTASYAVKIGTLTFSNPCGTVSADLLTFDPITGDASADNTGTAVLAKLKDSTGALVADGLTVGVAGTDVVLLTNVFTAGDPIDLAFGSIVHAP